MPMYSYTCRQCHNLFSDILLPIEQRLVPLSEPCPTCEATDCIELCVAAPALGDAFRLGRTQLPSAWTDKLSQIKDKHYKSTIRVPTPGKREV